MADDPKTTEQLQAKLAEMQGKLDDAIKTRDAAKGGLADLEARFKELESKASDAERDKAAAAEKLLSEQGNFKELHEKKSAEWEQREASLLDALKEATVKTAIIQAAVENNATDPDLVLAALGHGFDFDPQGLFPVANGDKLSALKLSTVGDDGQAKKVGALVKDFLDNRPNLVQAQSPAGGGGTTAPGVGAPQTTATKGTYTNIPGNANIPTDATERAAHILRLREQAEGGKQELPE